MRTLIAASLIIICIPGLVMSEELKLHTFESGTLIKADEFNRNFESIKKEINKLKDANGNTIIELNKLIKEIRSDLDELKRKYEAIQRELSDAVKNYDKIALRLPAHKNILLSGRNAPGGVRANVTSINKDETWQIVKVPDQ